MAGVPVSAVAAGAWAASAALAAVVVICLLAGRPIVGTESLGPEVLFESLAAAVVARFWNLPVALAAGVGIGVIEQVVAYNWPGGARVVVLFAVTAGAALVLRPRRGRRNESEGAADWLLVPVLPGRRRGGRWGGALAGPAALAAVALAVVGWASNSQALTFTTIAAYALLAISATLIVGVAGQLSLGQVGLFGVGAAVSYQLAAVVGIPFWLAFLGAGFTAGVVSALVGVPALRSRGPLFAVTSLGFALVAAGWLLSQPWLLGSGAYIPRPILGPIDLAGQRAYFVFAVVILGVAAVLARVLLRRSPGRLIVAVRDNEAAATSFGVVPAATKLAAFALAGFLAGIAGAVYGHGLQSVSVNDFPVASPGLQIGALDSLRIVAIAVIGGLGSVWGAVAAAALIVGVDELTTSAALRLLTTGAGLLLVLLVLPGGLAGLVSSARTRVGQIGRESG
jgi:ABC-type branched-subunit amino acid transport system permease subunit